MTLERIGSNVYQAINPGRNVLALFSYGAHFPIYANVGGAWYENTDASSQTTAKHRRKYRPQGVTLEPINTNRLKALLRAGGLTV